MLKLEFLGRVFGSRLKDSHRRTLSPEKRSSVMMLNTEAETRFISWKLHLNLDLPVVVSVKQAWPEGK